LPSIADILLRHGEPPLGAITGLPHRKQITSSARVSNRAPSSGRPDHSADRDGPNAAARLERLQDGLDCFMHVARRLASGRLI
jgi:hypothetical protein